MKKPLDDYVQTLGKVKVIRQPQREGLIRSRLAGAAAVQGDVIVFLDSHIEATAGWLEPLLDPISRNRTVVVTPIIDYIDDMTFKVMCVPASGLRLGGFDWNMLFIWYAVPEREQERRKSEFEPARTPTMAGGLYAISKSYFEELGRCQSVRDFPSDSRNVCLSVALDDPGMDIWGVENLEISFRIWMCGGKVIARVASLTMSGLIKGHSSRVHVLMWPMSFVNDRPTNGYLESMW